MTTKIKFQDHVYEFVQVDPGIWQLQEDLHIRLSKKHHCGIDITIPKGFMTDFRSGPDILNRVIPKLGIWYVIHDYLYQKGISTRKAADLEQHYWMKQCRVPLFQRMTITAGVLLLGKQHWQYYRNGGTFPPLPLRGR